MNVIRFKKKLIKRLGLCLLCVIVLCYVRRWLLSLGPKRSLDYDPVFRSFRLRKDLLLNYLKDSDENAANKTDGSEFVEFRLRSVSFEYTRISVQNWAESLEKAKVLGANCVEVEVAWNSHEPMPQKYQFDQNSNDLLTLIELARHYRLFVLVRIDPYMYCSRLDLGGLPSWLLADRNLETVETTLYLLDLDNSEFRSFFKKYLDEVFKFLEKYQASREGPVMGVVVQHFKYVDEKESLFKFYDEKYAEFVRDAMIRNRFFEMLLTSRPKMTQREGSVAYKWESDMHIYTPVDQLSSSYSSAKSEKIQEKAYIRNLIKSNCFDSPSKYLIKRNKTLNNPRLELEERLRLAELKTNLAELIQQKASFNLKNFFCATNFGFSNGAFHERTTGALLPSATSYLTAECLINENGLVTNTFHLFKNLIRTNTLPSQPKQLPKLTKLAQLNLTNLIELKINTFLPFEKIVKCILPPVRVKTELFIENVNLHYFASPESNHGFVLYRLQRALRKGSTLLVRPGFVRDSAVILCDSSQLIGSLQNGREELFFNIKFDCEQIEVLVENMGRLSDLTERDKFSTQRKGFLNKAAIGLIDSLGMRIEIAASEWQIYFFDFGSKFYSRVYLNSEWMQWKDPVLALNQPFMAFAKFNVNKVNAELKDNGVYLLMKNWSRGYAFLNGFNLGRYWLDDAAPSDLLTLFVPSFLLNQGQNELLIFEWSKTSFNNSASVYFARSHVHR